MLNPLSSVFRDGIQLQDCLLLTSENKLNVIVDLYNCLYVLTNVIKNKFSHS